MLEEQKNEPRYRLCDILGLASCLADEDFKKELAKEKIPDIDIYEIVPKMVEGEGEEVIRLVKQIKPRWATIYFNIREEYIKLLETFIKKE